MEIKINAIVPNRSNYQWSEIFGYTSKGQPGIEVIGLGSKGRAIKEKLTYLSKRRKLQFPVLRFVICAEGDDLDKCHSGVSGASYPYGLLGHVWSSSY